MNHRHGSWKMASMAASLVLMGGLASAGGSGGTLPMWPKGFSLVPQNALAVLSLEKGGKLLEKAGPG
ncbi:MAG TPA: hypothetical protein ENJ97_05155, partial [Planctomycetes bacterium]|nr:hypothetical protein [Planctomycetota bacterium]